MVDHRALLDDIVGGMNSGDYGFYDRHFTEDFIDEYPQSGEVLRGRENARWVLENYPRVNERERPVDQTVLRTQGERCLPHRCADLHNDQARGPR